MPTSPSQSDSPDAGPAKPRPAARDRQDQLVHWFVLVDDAPPLDAEWEEWAFGQLDSSGNRDPAAPHAGDSESSRS
jgi:hypothetical protein